MTSVRRKRRKATSLMNLKGALGNPKLAHALLDAYGRPLRRFSMTFATRNFDRLKAIADRRGACTVTVRGKPTYLLMAPWFYGALRAARNATAGINVRAKERQR